MIDWSSLFQGVGAVAIIGLVGIAIKSLFEANGTVLGTLLEDVKNLRTGAVELNRQLTVTNENLQSAQNALLVCQAGRFDDARQLRDLQDRIAELEAVLKRGG